MSVAAEIDNDHGETIEETTMKRWIGALSFLAAALAFAVTAQAEVTLKAVSGLPKQVVYTEDGLRFLEKLNEAGKGVVQVRWMGGPEVIPATEQAQALRNGVVDLVIAPANYHWGSVPESAAIAGSDKTPWELRANGAIDLLQKYYERKLNAHYLGWLSSNVGFEIYLREAPKRTDAGLPDLQGVKLRSNPVYQDFFAHLRATNITIQTPEVYAALERGTVDGVGWPEIGIGDFNWDKFLRFRIEPSFYRSDMVVLVNQSTWKNLAPEARALIEKTIAAYERESVAFFEAEKKKDAEKLKARGVQTVSLDGAAAQAFLAQAYEQIWARMARQVPEAAAELKARFYR